MQSKTWNTQSDDVQQQQMAPSLRPSARHNETELYDSAGEYEGAPRTVPRALKVVGYGLVILALFGMSVLAGMLSEHKSINLAAFKKAPQGEVKGEATTKGSSLSVGQSSDVNQAPGVQEKTATLTADNPYFQYLDTIKGIDITVTRQPLPDDFKANPNALQKLAGNIGATQTIPGTKQGTAYMLAAPGAQVVVFVYGDKLIFLRSLQHISNDDWKGYIDSFKPQ